MTIKSRNALIVIDLINAFSPRELYKKTQMPVEQLDKNRRNNINKILYYAEKKKFKIIFVNDSHTIEDIKRMNEPIHAIKGTPQTKTMEWVYKPKFSEIIYKRTYNGTTNPRLQELLTMAKVKKIFVLGTSTGACVYRTIVGLTNLGFHDITLIKDACGDIFPKRHYWGINRIKNMHYAQISSTSDVLFPMSKK